MTSILGQIKLVKSIQREHFRNQVKAAILYRGKAKLSKQLCPFEKERTKFAPTCGTHDLL